jgi:hypothetical protein
MSPLAAHAASPAIQRPSSVPTAVWLVRFGTCSLRSGLSMPIHRCGWSAFAHPRLDQDRLCPSIKRLRIVGSPHPSNGWELLVLPHFSPRLRIVGSPPLLPKNNANIALICTACKISRNRLLSRYINIATTQYNWRKHVLEEKNNKGLICTFYI